MYVPWKFPTKMRTRSSQLCICLADKCSSHVRFESARCNDKLRMMTSSVVAPCDNPPRQIPYYRLRPIHFGR
jgi:hypothetical protein